LQENIVWGQRANFIDIPTDCPQRNERVGWHKYLWELGFQYGDWCAPEHAAFL